MKEMLTKANGQSPRDHGPFAVLSVLIPVYNEVDLLPAELARVVAAGAGGLRKEVVIVDDGSRDGTRDYLRALATRWQEELARVARRLDIDLPLDVLNRTTLRVVFHPQNRGKGAAIRTAIDAATGDLCIVQDADLEYDPAEYDKLLRPILEGYADVVYGSRFLGGPHRVVYYWHAVGNRLLTQFSNMLTNLNLTDMETCYKVFRTDLLKTIHLTSDRFGFEPEVTAKVSKLGARVYEVPISYHGRTYQEGKKIGWRDGVSALWHILHFNLFPGTYCRDAGHETLRKLGAMRRFNQHLYQAIQPYLGKRVLEVGAGIGNITDFLARGRQVVATDVDPHYVGQLRERFRYQVGVHAMRWDASEPFPVDALPRTDARPADHDRGAAGFDTVVCLNVLEHVEDDTGALSQMQRLLAPGGRVILLVPAHPSLYSNLDREVGHYRRYSRGSLVAVARAAGLEVERLSPFNAWGLLGWWLNGRVLSRSRLPGGQLSLYNRLSGPLLRLERWLGLPVGISYIVICRPAAGKTGREQTGLTPVRTSATSAA
jgi:glycosyltransferase involved in cell wall biosynthesis